LRSGQAVGFQQLFGFLGQRVRDLLEDDENVRLQLNRGPRGTWRGTHAVTIVVITTIVKRKTSRLPSRGSAARPTPPYTTGLLVFPRRSGTGRLINAMEEIALFDPLIFRQCLVNAL
jgi:hypothetical protein